MGGVEVCGRNREVKGITDETGKVTIWQVQKKDSLHFISDPYLTYHYVAAKSELKAPVEIQLKTNPVYSLVKLPEGTEAPSFPGGKEALTKWLGENMIYPQEAIELGLQGKCYLRYAIETDGSITEIRVIAGVRDCPECDREAIRLVKAMPKWIPQKENGQPVKTYWTMPLIFKMS